MEYVMKRVSTALAFMTIVGHFFCCVLPLLSSLGGLGASVGLFAVNSPVMEWFADYEELVFLVAGMVISISALSQYISYRIDCHKTGCHHGACGTKKKWASKIFKFATALYVMNLLAFLLLPHTH
jgi:hypothetical protein